MKCTIFFFLVSIKNTTGMYCVYSMKLKLVNIWISLPSICLWPENYSSEAEIFKVIFFLMEWEHFGIVHTSEKISEENLYCHSGGVRHFFFFTSVNYAKKKK